jgi:hypothetical protein
MRVLAVRRCVEGNVKFVGDPGEGRIGGFGVAEGHGRRVDFREGFVGGEWGGCKRDSGVWAAGESWEMPGFLCCSFGAAWTPPSVGTRPPFRTLVRMAAGRVARHPGRYAGGVGKDSGGFNPSGVGVSSITHDPGLLRTPGYSLQRLRRTPQSRPPASGAGTFVQPRRPLHGTRH